MTTSQHLRTIATTWTDLADALGTPTQTSWPPVTLRGYLTSLEQYDLEEATALRMLERDPSQIGARPIPISLRVHDTMRTIEAGLAECADAIAAVSQIEPIPFPGREWPADDRARRTARARADLADPRRWRFRGNTPPAPYTALWLLARVERRPGPFRTLTEAQHRHIGHVAREAVARIEAVLDLADGKRELGDGHRCACGGRIVVYGGAGATPCANCRRCGALWTEGGIIVAA
ncbi:hypothetical protein HRW18_05535 [Streptomyces lunaelactis]|uniref:hypothetical protein n=1 Tax=Streptomyces lunaelactis TaxID=1535768 RepID=UPI0015852386|nr:hypothetical protein [Streptomyces lunaelactis]NUK07485.1 hypothetical protein [Streptomyces lunaelactis]